MIEETIVNYSELKKDLISATRVWLVTGVAGFIGSNLLETLLQNHQNVVGLDNFSSGTCDNLEKVRELVTPEQWGRFKLIEGDICSLESCRDACKNVDFVLHHAALGSVSRSLEDPITTNKNNIDGFLNVLVSARDEGVKRFVYAASSSTYGDDPNLPKNEDVIGGPLSPYAVTKLVNELYAKVFARSYGIETIGLRYFNIFGRRQNPKGAYAAVIPAWIHAILNDEVPVIYGDGKNSRDFCYIDNAVQANLLAALTDNKKAINQVFNVAVGDVTSLEQLYQYIVDELKVDKSIRPRPPIYKDFRIGDLPHSQANIEKARSLLNYQPSHNIKAGLRETVQWYLDNVPRRNKRVTS